MYRIALIAVSAILSLTDARSGACFNPSAYNNGVGNEKECGNPGSTGLNWCEDTAECIRGPECPECNNDKHIWCEETATCCEYDCTIPEFEVVRMEECELISYWTQTCELNDGGIAFTREYFAECPDCGETVLRNGEFGKLDCSTDGAKDMNKMYTFDVKLLDGECGEFRFVEEEKAECEAVIEYVPGIPHAKKCQDDELYCITTDRCYEKGSLQCPRCSNDFPDFCQLLGGGKCCARGADVKCMNDDKYSSVIGLGNKKNYFDQNFYAKSVGSACFNPSGYNNGVNNEKRCHSGSTGMRWCASIGECVRGATCPECANDKHIWCKDTQFCCEYDCEAKATPSPVSGSACFNPIGFNTGVANTKECGPSGSTGLKWCEATGECVRGPKCPECQNEKHLWCKETESCCEYDCAAGGEKDDECIQPRLVPGIPHTSKCAKDRLYCKTTDKCYRKGSLRCPRCNSDFPSYCALLGGGKCCTVDAEVMCLGEDNGGGDDTVVRMEDCELISYSTQSCPMNLDNDGYSREYFALCPDCGEDTILRSGQSECSLDDFRDMDSKYTMDVQCDLGEFDFVENECVAVPEYVQGKPHTDHCIKEDFYCKQTKECNREGRLRCPRCPKGHPDFFGTYEDGKCCAHEDDKYSASFLKKVAIGNQIGIPERGLPQTYQSGHSNSASKKDGSACFNPDGYNMGVNSEKKCSSGSTGMRWCESIGECVRGTKCPECRNDKHIWCKDTESCCEYDCEATPSPVSGGVCFNPVGFNNGVNSERECSSGSTGLRYCEATDDCVRGPKCPECANKHIWCEPKNSCCDYDCEGKNDCITVDEKSDCNSKYPYFQQMMGGRRCCANPV